MARSAEPEVVDGVGSNVMQRFALRTKRYKYSTGPESQKEAKKVRKTAQNISGIQGAGPEKIEAAVSRVLGSASMRPLPQSIVGERNPE